MASRFYEWAGEYRTVELFKGVGRGFAEVKTGEVDRYLSDVNRLVRGTEWGRLDRQKFGERAANVFAYLNQAHPFREATGARRRCSWSTWPSGRGSPSTTAG